MGLINPELEELPILLCFFKQIKIWARLIISSHLIHPNKHRFTIQMIHNLKETSPKVTCFNGFAKG